ncbi:MAG: hypothetical protein JWP69_1759 [Flaviaesturariibacter sp.]|nr:hypothetical protein [Flaviaesturariibacter sp.]
MEEDLSQLEFNNLVNDLINKKVEFENAVAVKSAHDEINNIYNELKRLQNVMNRVIIKKQE